MGSGKIALVCHLCMIFTLSTVRADNIDKCVTTEQMIPPCSQVCESKTDGYRCHCMTGYILAGDNQTCLVEGSEPNLFVVSSRSISVFNVETDDLSNTVQFPGYSLTDLAFGPARHLLLVENNGTVIYETRFNQTNVNVDIHPIIDSGIHHVTGVVIDWLTSNIYLVDKHAGRIVVCTSKGDNCSILIDKLIQPVSLTINALDGSLFWSEWKVSNLSGTIRCAYLDGDNARVIVDDLNQPYNLVIDSTLNLIYWLDTVGAQYVVYSAKLNGENKREIIRREFNLPHMAVFEDNIYLTEGNDILIVNKFSGHILKKHTLDVDYITVMDMYHDVLYNTGNFGDPCVSTPCSHICVPSNAAIGYRCLCGVDESVSDAGTCTKKLDEEKLLVSGMSGIYEVSLNYIGYHGNRKRKILHDDVSCLVYDAKQGRIFYFADTRRAILKTYINALQNSLSVYSEINRLEDMAFDASSEVLYWTTAFGNVHAGSVDGAYSTTIITDLDKPRGITLDLESGYLYICDWGHTPAILQCHMDGSNCTTFIHVDGGHPNIVVIATAIAMEYGSHDMRKTLYWTDSKLDMIGYIHLDGVGVSKGEFLLKHNSNTHPYSLVVSRDRIYFTDWNTKHLHYIQGTSLSVVMDIDIDAGTLYSLTSTKKPTNVPTTVCSVDNGGCPHLCLSKPNKRRTCLSPHTGHNITFIDNPAAIITPETQIHVPTDTEVSGTFSSNIGRVNVPTINDPSSNQTPTPQVPSRHSAEEEDVDTNLLAIILVSGALILITVFVILVVIYQRRKHQKRSWMSKLIHYVKTQQTDDVEGLVSNSYSTIASDPSFKQYEDVDYPEDKYSLSVHGNDYRRQISIVSVDSAFNEMREFDTYASSENLGE